jgi:hypothetical protein
MSIKGQVHPPRVTEVVGAPQPHMYPLQDLSPHLTLLSTSTLHTLWASRKSHSTFTKILTLTTRSFKVRYPFTSDTPALHSIPSPSRDRGVDVHLVERGCSYKLPLTTDHHQLPQILGVRTLTRYRNRVWRNLNLSMTPQGPRLPPLTNPITPY